MNSKNAIVGLVAVMAVLSGALGMSLTGTFSDQKIGVTNVATGMITGHLEIEARNADGEVIAYRQTDNEVVDDGEQCILKMLFGSNHYTDATRATPSIGRGEYTSIGAGACTGAVTGAWDVIGIGTTGDAADDVNIKLGNETSGILANYTDGVEGLERGIATTKTWSNGTGGGNADNTKIVMSKTFTNLSAVTKTIAESGLFNSTTVAGSGMLAHKAFTGVALATSDSITITWTFIVGD